MPTVRFFVLPFTIADTPFPTIAGWTGQEWLDSGAAEILAVARRAVSVAAPVYCRQMMFYYDATGFQWVAVAVPYGSSPPTHYRLKGSDAPVAWGERWRQAPGEGVADGVAYSVFFFPQVQGVQSGDFSETPIFEWPL